MHLKVQKRNGRDYLSIVQSYREGGRVRSRTIETIGYADDYAADMSDPIEHFRNYAAELTRKERALVEPVRFSFAPNEPIERETSAGARLGAAIALGCLDSVGVRGFFNARSGHNGFPAHAGRIFEMLACERMMHATSKRESWTARGSFPRPCDFSYEDVYAALACFSRERGRLDACHLKRLHALVGQPSVERVFLVCGSYAFPVDGGSMRASIAVATDRTGMPLGFHDMQGKLDAAAFREAADTLRRRLGARRAVIIAGGLRDPQPAIDELAKTGDGFIFYQRDYTLVPGLAEWVSDERSYVPTSEGALAKQRTTTRTLPSGSTIPVKEVAISGGGYAVRRKYAVLVSSETDMSAAALVNSYRELWRQAEPFQPLEADFASVPYPTSALDHIQAHFSICYAAFLALRLLRRTTGWKFNAADTADALLRMEGAHLQRNYYLFSYRSEVTDCIEQSVGIAPAQRLRTKSEIRSVPATVRRALESSRVLRGK